jgi:hypothetical protein
LRHAATINQLNSYRRAFDAIPTIQTGP